MKLSEQLAQDHASGDFGMALEGYAERAEALESEVARLNDVVDRLRGQLQHCVSLLDRANRQQFNQEYSSAIEWANKALYETLVDGGGR